MFYSTKVFKHTVEKGGALSNYTIKYLYLKHLENVYRKQIHKFSGFNGNELTSTILKLQKVQTVPL